MSPPKCVALASSCQVSVCTLLFHIHHGVEPYVLEDESINGVSSVRLSSGNCNPHSVLSKDFILFKK